MSRRRQPVARTSRGSATVQPLLLALCGAAIVTLTCLAIYNWMAG